MQNANLRLRYLLNRLVEDRLNASAAALTFVTLFALVPLLMSANAPGKEVLHPVAVVIFGGLISSTVLDTVLTPLMFWLWGRKPLAHLLSAHSGESSRGGRS